MRHASYERVYWAQAPSRTDAPSFDGSTGGPKVRQTDTENLTLQSDLTARADLLGMKHELLAGVEYLKEDASRRSLQDLDPGAGRFYRPGAFTSAPAITYRGDTLALYAQDTIEFVPNWKLTLGARHDSLDAEC